MITIERDCNAFKVKVKDSGFGSYRMRANTVQEAALCVIHYFGGDNKHSGENKKCPACRRVTEETKKFIARQQRERKRNGAVSR